MENNKLTKELLSKPFEYRRITWDSKYKYKLNSEYAIKLNVKPEAKITGDFYTLLPSGLLTISADYEWDGASGPAIDTKNIMRASLVHDVLYQMIRCGQLPYKYKKDSDKELPRIMNEDSTSVKFAGKIWDKLREFYCYSAVRLFGFLSLRKKNELES